MRVATGIFFALLLGVSGCSRDGTTGAAPAEPVTSPPAAPAAPPAPNPDPSSRPKVVVLGDRLSAGLGLAQTEAYPALLQDKLRAAGFDWDVVNAAVSGDTSAAGLQRVDWALDEPNVRILVLELGANDGLRGLPVDEMKRNLG